MRSLMRDDTGWLRRQTRAEPLCYGLQPRSPLDGFSMYFIDHVAKGRGPYTRVSAKTEHFILSTRFSRRVLERTRRSSITLTY